MATTTSQRSKSRATSKGSKMLNPTENAYVHQNLTNRQIAQATAVVQLLEAEEYQWVNKGMGALCFVKDSHQRSYFLNLFLIQAAKQKPFWEHEIYDNINVVKTRSLFLQFSALNKQVGINFADSSEAETVYNLMKEKSKNKNVSKLIVKPHTTMPMSNDRPISISHESIPIENPRKSTQRLDKSKIGLPTDFRHIKGVKICGSEMKIVGKNEGGEQSDNDMKKLLMDMKLIDDEEFTEIFKNDEAKNQIYGYIESIGGITRARQSIRPEELSPRFQRGSQMHTKKMTRTIHDHPPKPPNRISSIREDRRPPYIRPPPPPPPDVRHRPGPVPMPPKAPPCPSFPTPPPAPPAPQFSPSSPNVGRRVEKPSPKPATRQSTVPNDLLAEINKGSFALKRAEVIPEERPSVSDGDGDIHSTLASMLCKIRQDIEPDHERDDLDEWSD